MVESLPPMGFSSVSTKPQVLSPARFPWRHGLVGFAPLAAIWKRNRIECITSLLFHSIARRGQLSYISCTDIKELLDILKLDALFPLYLSD